MDITALIRELLFSHDCVIVPGFGGFLCNYKPARIDKASGTFHPPVKEISFNRILEHNDGLLIQRICSAGITYADARSMVECFVADLARKLEKSGSISIEKIGVFTRNHEGNLEFEPDRTVNYHIESFGLDSFQCFPLEKYNVRKRIISPEPVRQLSYRKYLWRAAVLVPVAAVIIAVTFRTNLFGPRIEDATLNPLVTAELEHNRAAVDSHMNADTGNMPVSGIPVSKDTIAAKEPAQPSATTANDRLAEEKAGGNAAPGTSGDNSKIARVRPYYIITGSFQSMENAGKQVKLLQAEGFNPEVVDGGNGFYRVCAMACPDLETALAKKDSIDRKFPGSWISRKK